MKLTLDAIRNRAGQKMPMKGTSPVRRRESLPFEMGNKARLRVNFEETPAGPGEVHLSAGAHM